MSGSPFGRNCTTVPPLETTITRPEGRTATATPSWLPVATADTWPVPPKFGSRSPGSAAAGRADATSTAIVTTTTPRNRRTSPPSRTADTTRARRGTSTPMRGTDTGPPTERPSVLVDTTHDARDRGAGVRRGPVGTPSRVRPAGRHHPGDRRAEGPDRAVPGTRPRGLGR